MLDLVQWVLQGHGDTEEDDDTTSDNRIASAAVSLCSAGSVEPRRRAPCPVVRAKEKNALSPASPWLSVSLVDR